MIIHVSIIYKNMQHYTILYMCKSFQPLYGKRWHPFSILERWPFAHPRPGTTHSWFLLVAGWLRFFVYIGSFFGPVLVLILVHHVDFLYYSLYFSTVG